ncbi:MAG: DKNYY domain-containing protein, partial [Ferruginibacter sp.]
YAKDTAHAYYFGYHNDLYNGIHQIPCLVASFIPLTYPYAKDAASVFYLYNKISEADLATFSIIGNGFSKDKAHVYSTTKILQGADPATFVLLPYDSGSLDEYFYSKDKVHAFWKNKMFDVADIAAFKVLGLGYSTDGKHVYYHTNIVKEADASTFTAYEYNHTEEDAKDAKNKYFEGKIAVEY